MTKRNSAFSDMDAREILGYGEYDAEHEELLYEDSVWDEALGARVTRVLLRDCVSGATRQISAGSARETSPRFSPDLRKVAFLSRQGQGGDQLYVWDRDTGETRQLTTLRFGATDPLWSPDGRMIAFSSSSAGDMDEDWLCTLPDPEESAVYARERAKEPVVITDFGYKFDGLGFAKPEVLQLWVVPADGSGKPRRITREKADFLHAGWAPDSEHIVCESDLYCDKAIGIAMDVLLIDIRTGEIARVTKDEMVVSYPNPVRPVFTPDGKYIIVGILDYGENVDLGNTYPSCTLYRISPDGQERVKIFEKTDTCFDSVQFAYDPGCGRGLEKLRVSSDGCQVYFHSGSMGAGVLWKTAIYGEDHRPRMVCGGKMAWNGLGVPHGGKVLVTGAATDQPEAYYLLDEETGERELLLQSNEDWLREVNLSRAEDFFFDTLDGESRVQGFVLPPQDREPGKKYPAILYIHGGPHPFYTFGFDLEMQCFAGEGFGVLYCNPRGSSGYGDVHRNIARSTDGSAYTDIMQFVSEACRRYDWIDPDRLGVTGGSYGGYMTNYIASHSKRFKAYITQRTVVNELIDYASSDMQGQSKDFPTFGEFMVHEVERSVICGMERVSAPFLILHGMEDYRCPVEGAHQLFVALKDTHPEDFPIKMVLYPHLGHDQPQEPRQRQHYYKTMTDWFRTYL